MSTCASLYWCPLISLIPTDEMILLRKLLFFWEVIFWTCQHFSCVCMPVCGREPTMYPQNITRHIYACEKCYRDHPFLPRGFSTWHKFQRAAEPWCSCVVPCSCAWSWFMLFGSHSQRGTCHPTAQFSAALASLQPLGSVLWGLETTLPYSLLSLWRWGRAHLQAGL